MFVMHLVIASIDRSACSTCFSGMRRTQGCWLTSSGLKSSRPHGIAGQPGHFWVALITICCSGVPQGPKIRSSVGPKSCSVRVFCATARWRGPLSTPSTNNARASIAANCPTVISLRSNGGVFIPRGNLFEQWSLRWASREHDVYLLRGWI